MWEANPSESDLSEARPPRGLEIPAPGPPEGPKSRSRMRTREARPPLGGPKVAGVSPAAGDDW